MIRDGYTRLQFCDGGSLTLQLCEYDQVLTAWREGQRWYEGRDCYGDSVTSLLDGLRFVSRNSAAGVAQYREEQQLDKLEGVE